MRSYNDKSICCFRFKQCNTISITNLGERWTTSTVRLSHTMCECLYLFFSASLILLVLLSWGVNELLSIIECFFSFSINSFCLIDYLLNSSICLFLAHEGGHVHTVGIIPNWGWRRTYVHGSGNLNFEIWSLKFEFKFQIRH